MRYSIAVKFIAIVLAALALVAVFACCLGIIQVAELGLYTDGFDGWVQNRLEWQAYSLAEDLTDRFAVRKLTNCPDEVLQELGYWYVFEESIHWTGLNQESYDFIITDPENETLASAAGLPDLVEGFSYQTECTVQFPVMVTDEELIDQTYGTEYLHRKVIRPEIYGGKAVTVRYYESPGYTVSVTLDPDAAMARSGTSLELLQLIYDQRYNLMVVLAVALIVLGASLVYLCCAAGQIAPKTPAKAEGLNKLPLDLYGAAGGIAGYLLGTLVFQMINYWIFQMDNLNPGTLVMVGGVLLGIALLCVGFYFALCAQIKTGDLYWLKNTILAWLLQKLWIGLKYVAKAVRAMLALLPIIWRYVVIGTGMALCIAAAAFLATDFSVVPLILVAALYVGVICYSGYSYATLYRGAWRMAGGELDSKVDCRFLTGNYRKCGEYLNALADVAIMAAKNQMKSERMRSELITNVSHDIKTPLTSIINYVDLLQNTQKAEEAAQYLQVLSRQSQRLKKLIEDLMEMSKASSGNIPTNPAPMDPVETVNQALGEFSDKLSSKDLTVVFRQPEEPLTMIADGRLTWRVISNLLSNIVKYSLPGTRVYADVLAAEDKVLISLKNISQEPLNVSADELTERFVQGDPSRNTEGSGLGLNIAKSLMELQKGQLQLLVDGDLFKATLVFQKG